VEVIIVDDTEQIGPLAAQYIAAQVTKKPDSVLGVATGSSPLNIYADLGRRVAAGELSLAQCSAFMLDEYVGLPADHPERYRNFIDREFVARVDIEPTNVHGPDGLADDLFAACEEYEAAINAAGGVDIQILGVGTDGHIAFNEPGTSLAARTHIGILTEQTRRDNARFFDGDIDQVPQLCLTQGVGTILAARHLLLVANGAAKAEAIAAIVEGPVTSMWTGSALQLHPQATVIVDEAAAGQLKLTDYYKQCYAAKPDFLRP